MALTWNVTDRRMDAHTDGQTDKVHSYNPLTTLLRGLKILILLYNDVIFVSLCCAKVFELSTDNILSANS